MKSCFFDFFYLFDLKISQNGSKKMLFSSNPLHFLRRIWWSYWFFLKIKLNAIFWGLKLKNYGNFRSTKIFVFIWNRSFLSEKKVFFKKYLIFCVKSYGLVRFLRKSSINPYFDQKPRKLVFAKTWFFDIKKLQKSTDFDWLSGKIQKKKSKKQLFKPRIF